MISNMDQYRSQLSPKRVSSNAQKVAMLALSSKKSEAGGLRADFLL